VTPAAASSGVFALGRFAETIGSASWFAACGEPLTGAEHEEAAGWMAELGVEVADIERVASWEEAAGLAKSPDWSRLWWDAEEGERKRLYRAAAEAAGEAALLAALTRVTDVATRLLHGAASVAASRAGVADPALTRVAAGAASQACYQAALALAAGAGDAHPFAAKHRLFLAGRWPLGVVGERCFVF
jgi:hypothetical protein